VRQKLPPQPQAMEKPPAKQPGTAVAAYTRQRSAGKEVLIYRTPNDTEPLAIRALSALVTPGGVIIIHVNEPRDEQEPAYMISPSAYAMVRIVPHGGE
jgi:hypothetical protein